MITDIVKRHLCPSHSLCDQFISSLASISSFERLISGTWVQLSLTWPYWDSPSLPGRKIKTAATGFKETLSLASSAWHGVVVFVILSLPSSQTCLGNMIKMGLMLSSVGKSLCERILASYLWLWVLVGVARTHWAGEGHCSHRISGERHFKNGKTLLFHYSQEAKRDDWSRPMKD